MEPVATYTALLFGLIELFIARIPPTLFIFLSCAPTSICLTLSVEEGLCPAALH